MTISLTHRIALSVFKALVRRTRFDNRLILVLGTMRSGSTLLTNILISNIDVEGFGESHVKYKDVDSIKELYYWILRYSGYYPGNSRYILDKILHAGHIPDIQGLMASIDIVPIFITRDPIGNAESLIKRFRSDFSFDPKSAFEYLGTRYDELLSLLAKIPYEKPIASVSYEALINNSEATLDVLSDFLNLVDKLTPEYKVNRQTGRWGLGDGGDKIRSGKIIIEQSKSLDPQIISPPIETIERFEYLRRNLMIRAECVIH